MVIRYGRIDYGRIFQTRQNQMKRSVLAARRQLVIESIAEQAERLGAEPIDLVTGLRGDSEHRQLAMLERIAVFLSGIEQAVAKDTAVRYSLDDILSIPGLTKTSIKAIEEAFNVSSD